MSRGWVFLDRDGTIIRFVDRIRDLEDVHLLPNALRALSLLKNNDFKLALITNQAAVGRDEVSREQICQVNERLEWLLHLDGITFDAVRCCTHRAEDNCVCRKPKPGMILDVLSGDPGTPGIAMIGDSACDIGAGKSAGLKTFLVRTGLGEQNIETCSPDKTVSDVLKAAELIIKKD
jgi:D-glycero-D-manno-heptose 1,7-bisphosphate phosphatase